MEQGNIATFKNEKKIPYLDKIVINLEINTIKLGVDKSFNKFVKESMKVERINGTNSSRLKSINIK